MSTVDPVELHARAGRAVLVGHDGTALRDVDPRSLALDGELTESLHEWAQVAQALVPNDHQPVGGTAGDLVSRRGRQLAGRLATELGHPVHYADPVSGVVQLIEPALPPAQPVADLDVEDEEPAEPTPWGTGLTVTVVTAAVVVIAVTSLSSALAQANVWLAVVANVVVVGGLSPSVWLARRVPTWRWVALGVASGLVLAWIVLLLSLLGG